MPATERMTPVQRIALIAIGVSQLLVAADYSSVYVAMPSMGTDLGMSNVALQWIVTAYGLPFAGFLLLGGRLVDRLGAVRIFVIGNIVFGLGSVLAALSTEGWMLLAGRTTQGLAAALMSPAILSLLSANFPSGRIRARAYSVWGAIGASGLAVGVLQGGALTEMSWRWIFLINIPLVIFCLWSTRQFSHGQSKGTVSGKVPVTSTTLGTLAVLLVVLSLTFVGDSSRTSSSIFIASIAAAITLIAFLINERRSAAPLVERALRKVVTLRRGSVAAALYMSSVGTEFFLVTLFLQDQRDYSPLIAGIAFIPLAALVTFGNIFAGRLLANWRSSRVLALGFAISTIGLLLLAFSLPIENYWIGLLPGFAISGFGHGMIFTSMFVLGNSDVQAELSGAAGSLITAAQYASAAFGTAVLTIIIVTIEGTIGFAWGFGFNALVAIGGIVLAMTTRDRTPQKLEHEPEYV